MVVTRFVSLKVKCVPYVQHAVVTIHKKPQFFPTMQIGLISLRSEDTDVQEISNLRSLRMVCQYVVHELD